MPLQWAVLFDARKSVPKSLQRTSQFSKQLLNAARSLHAVHQADQHRTMGSANESSLDAQSSLPSVSVKSSLHTSLGLDILLQKVSEAADTSHTTSSLNEAVIAPKTPSWGDTCDFAVRNALSADLGACVIARRVDAALPTEKWMETLSPSTGSQFLAAVNDGIAAGLRRSVEEPVAKRRYLVEAMCQQQHTYCTSPQEYHRRRVRQTAAVGYRLLHAVAGESARWHRADLGMLSQAARFAALTADGDMAVALMSALQQRGEYTLAAARHVMLAAARCRRSEVVAAAFDGLRDAQGDGYAQQLLRIIGTANCVSGNAVEVAAVISALERLVVDTDVGCSVKDKQLLVQALSAVVCAACECWVSAPCGEETSVVCSAMVASLLSSVVEHCAVDILYHPMVLESMFRAACVDGIESRAHILMASVLSKSHSSYVTPRAALEHHVLDLSASSALAKLESGVNQGRRPTASLLNAIWSLPLCNPDGVAASDIRDAFAVLGISRECDLYNDRTANMVVSTLVAGLIAMPSASRTAQVLADVANEAAAIVERHLHEMRLEACCVLTLAALQQLRCLVAEDPTSSVGDGVCSSALRRIDALLISASSVHHRKWAHKSPAPLLTASEIASSKWTMLDDADVMALGDYASSCCMKPSHLLRYLQAIESALLHAARNNNTSPLLSVEHCAVLLFCFDAITARMPAVAATVASIFSNLPVVDAVGSAFIRHCEEQRDSQVKCAVRCAMNDTLRSELALTLPTSHSESAMPPLVPLRDAMMLPDAFEAALPMLARRSRSRASGHVKITGLAEASMD